MEAMGLASRAVRMGLVVAACHWAEAFGDQPPLRPIAEVLAIPAADLSEGVPVRVHGVVVLVQSNFGAVQDAGHGIWLQALPSLRADLADGTQRAPQLGDLVEATGVVDRGGFAPAIKSARLVVVGEMPLPVPVPADLGRLFRGYDNAVRVEVGSTFEAIVQGCREDRDEWNLVVDAAAQKIVVRIAKSMMPAKPDHLIDARVKIVGIVGSTRNSRGQFLAPTLRIAHVEDIEVLASAPSSPFESPRVSLAEIAAYQPEPVTRHRIQTDGVVTCHVPGRYCYLQEGLVGLRVDCPSASALAPGDVVRVAGFVDMSHAIAGIAEGVVEKTGRVDPPPPVDIMPEEIVRILTESYETGLMALPTNYAGVLIHFPATLVERQRFQDGWMLTLGRGETSVLAQLPSISPGDAEILESLQPGSDVEVTGIARIDAEPPTDYLPTGHHPEVRPVGLVLRSAADVRVVRAPSWWTPRRLAAALAAAGAVLATVLGWVRSLRRELAVQVDRVAYEIRSRREAEVEFDATLRERNRLAANLHDTVLQTLGGIRYQLDACRVAGREMADAEAGEHFDVARRMIDHAAQEVRGSVWALRTMPMPGRSITESIAMVISQFEKQLGKALRATITFHASGTPVELPSFVAGNLLLVVQEAIHNALRHAAPTQVDVEATFAADGSLTVTVQDDGAGFLPGTEAGPAQGHFGLQGMRERLERLGGTLEIESAPEAGTTITAQVRQPAGAPLL